MSSIPTQFLDLTAHHDRYDAIDPQSALKDSAAGKVVFIAGASRGIGQATAVAFAQAGAAAVYLTARSEDALQETQSRVAQANPETRCAFSICDVTDAAQVAAAVADCVAQFGGIDVADANAGYLGSYHVIRYTMAHLIESAKQRAAEGRSGGHLILMSSIGAQFVMPGASDYQTSKHAINRLCEFVQSDHEADGIKCYAMHPGGVATDLGHQMPEAMHEHLIDTPDLAACFAVWLSSGAADWAKGRYVSANWDVSEFTALQNKIVEDDLLVNRLRAG